MMCSVLPHSRPASASAHGLIAEGYGGCKGSGEHKLLHQETTHEHLVSLVSSMELLVVSYDGHGRPPYPFLFGDAPHAVWSTLRGEGVVRGGEVGGFCTREP